MNFLIGGLTGVIATTLILPFDCIKIQMQLRSETGEKRVSLITTVKDIYIKNNRSIKPFYKGIDSALIRQIIINSVGLGLFYQINDTIVKEITINADMISGNTPYCLFYRKKSIISMNK